MGFKKISGVEWECENSKCDSKEMVPDQTDVDGAQIPPKGWLTGNVRESTGERGSATGVVSWVACKAACVGSSVRTALQSRNEAEEAPEDA